MPFITFPFSLLKRWRSPLANPTTKRLILRLAQDTAVAAPLNGRSATNSFSPDVTDQTTTFTSSPKCLSTERRGWKEDEKVPMLIKRLHPWLIARWFTGLVWQRRVFWSLNSILSDPEVIVIVVTFSCRRKTQEEHFSYLKSPLPPLSESPLPLPFMIQNDINVFNCELLPSVGIWWSMHT